MCGSVFDVQALAITRDSFVEDSRALGRRFTTQTVPHLEDDGRRITAGREGCIGWIREEDDPEEAEPIGSHSGRIRG